MDYAGMPDVVEAEVLYARLFKHVLFFPSSFL